jgi:hypothetical protein
MIRSALSALLLGLLILAEPCLATADTTGNSKKPPQKPAPQIVQPTPSSPSKSKLKKYRSLNTYHPHQAKGHKHPGKPGTT